MITNKLFFLLPAILLLGNCIETPTSDSDNILKDGVSKEPHNSAAGADTAALQNDADAAALQNEYPAAPLKFRKKIISAEAYETAAAFDVNHDGQLDIVSGAYWYAGPAFEKRNPVGKVQQEGEFYDDFSTIPIDVNGDGYLDFITGGWFGNSVRWRENPKGAAVEWKEHKIADVGNVEGTRAWDVDGDGVMEVVPNTPGRPLRCFKLEKSTGTFTQYQLYDKQGHGFGFGDINGDGRGDFVLPDGWLEAPANPWVDKWIFHPDFRLGETGIPVVVTDLNGDGLNDLIVGQGHGYGLHWYEQQEANGGQDRKWLKHDIDTKHSQFHTLMWEDLDGDAKPELITGKRYRAHNDKDDGAADDYGLYYYTWNGKTFTKHVIVFGPKGTGKGTGNYFTITDMDKNGKKDIVVGGKDGLWVFYNE